MIILIAVMLLLMPTWSMAQESEEISLAELARRERERRAAMGKPVRIITNANIGELRGLVSTSGAPASVAAEGEGEEVGSEENSENGEGDAQDWQALFAEATLNLKNAVNRGLVLELKMNDLRNSYFSESDGTTKGRLQQLLTETQQEMVNSQGEVAAARQALGALQNEAQADGVPPGTIRDLVGDLPQAESIATSPGS